MLVALLRLIAPAPLEMLDLKVLDFRHQLRGPLPAGNDVVIVAIDEASLLEVGRWPWPRTRLAALVQRLTDAGAALIGFDVVFDQPDPGVDLKALRAAAGTSPNRLARELLDLVDDDEQLAAAFRASGRVVLGHFFEFGMPAKLDGGSEEVRFPELSVLLSSGADLASVREGMRLHGNIPLLLAASSGAGHVNFFPDADGAYRRVPTAVRFGDRLSPALTLELLRHYGGSGPAMMSVARFGVASLRLGERDLPVDEAGELWINYLGPPKTFRYVSAADVLGGRIPSGSLAGKITLVGFTAAGYEKVSTPFGPVVPGVEVQATIVDNILRGMSLSRPRWLTPIEAAIVVFLGLALGLAPRPFGNASGAVTAAVIGFAYAASTQHLFSTSGVVLSGVYPLGGVFLCALGIAVFQSVAEEREKRKIREMFGHYVNTEVMELLVREPERVKLGGERREISILFSDIRDFTAISEKLAVENLRVLLGDYLGAMTDVVFRHQGLLDKYVGDSIMAFWGAPVLAPDHAARCCRAAIDMQDALPALNRRWHERRWPTVSIRLGIDTGEALVGNFGSSTRFNYTAMGDHVNVASRLEGLNKIYGTHVLISDSTRRAIGDEFICREVDCVRVMGKREAASVSELLGRSEADRDGRLRRLADGFASALRAYRAKAWAQATVRFERLAAEYPDDGPTGVYLERCRKMDAEPPPDGWDGVFVAETK